MPSRDFTSEDLFSSRMMSMQSSTHSSQMNTVGPAMSLRTSCWDLPQNEQYRVFFESPDLLMRTPAPDSRGAKGRLYPPRAPGNKNREGPGVCAVLAPQERPPASSAVGRYSTTSSTRPKSRLSSADI